VNNILSVKQAATCQVCCWWW